MTVRRLLAIGLIFLGATAAWSVLGTSLVARSGEFDGRLKSEVPALWGGPHRQVAADAWILRPKEEKEILETKAPDGDSAVRGDQDDEQAVTLDLLSTRATADLDLEHRQRGLAVVCHLRGPVPGDLSVPQPRRRAARGARAAAAAGRATCFRRRRIPRRRAAADAGQPGLEGAVGS